MTNNLFKISFSCYKPVVWRLILIVTTTTLFATLAVPAFAVETITAHPNIGLTANTADFPAGEKESANNAINWTSDVDWIVTVKSLNPNLGQSDDLTYTKPLNDLLWKLSSGSTWVAMTTSDVTIQTGGVGSGSGSFNVDYKFLLSWSSDKPGTYTTALQYTISAQ